MPPGISLRALEFPCPERLEESGLVTFGHSGEVLLLAAFEADAGLPAGRVTLKLKAEWLECLELCVPKRAEVEMEVPVCEGRSPPMGAHAALFGRWRGRMPAKAAGWAWAAGAEGDTVRLRVRPPADGRVDLREAQFFPARRGAVELAELTNWKQDGNEWVLTMTKGAEPPQPGELFEGVLALAADKRGADRPAFAVSAVLGAE